MVLGVGLMALVAAQAYGAAALWPASSVSSATKGARPIVSEEINELTQKVGRLEDELETVREDRDRLDKNERAAIEERDQLKIDKAGLELKVSDLHTESVRLRKDATRARIESDAKKS